MFNALFAGLSRHLPGQCLVCHSWPAQSICEACVTQFAQPVFRCETCARAMSAPSRRCGQCITQPNGLDAALAAVSYEYPWSRWVVSLKFHEQTAHAQTMATLMRSTPWVEPAIDLADMLVPMPLSVQRLAQRGFNQTLLLAHALHRPKVQAGLLLRVQDTPPQSTLTRSERLQSVKNAYAVDPLKRSDLKDKRVVLVDDVMTSGASLAAAATALRRAGAAHVTGLVFARAES